jgi:hypothetical protein
MKIYIFIQNSEHQEALQRAAELYGTNINTFLKRLLTIIIENREIYLTQAGNNDAVEVIVNNFIQHIIVLQ